jgi:hypothetical protein
MKWGTMLIVAVSMALGITVARAVEYEANWFAPLGQVQDSAEFQWYPEPTSLEGSLNPEAVWLGKGDVFPVPRCWGAKIDVPDAGYLQVRVRVGGPATSWSKPMPVPEPPGMMAFGLIALAFSSRRSPT